jgi:uncharacterized DUF497 family protein
MELNIEWDPQKEASNQRKHGVSFVEAVTALEDELALTVEDDLAGEPRFISLGRGESGRLLVVVYTYRGASIRIISTRKATAAERKAYEEQNDAGK